MLILILFFFSFFSFASQPSGLVLPPPILPGSMRILRNKHITYSSEDENKKQKVEEVIIYKTKFKVKGRSRPNRSGSVMSVIDEGEIVEPIKDSEDKKWKAVIVKKSELRVWVPMTALTRKKITKKAHSSSDESVDFNEDASSDE